MSSIKTKETHKTIPAGYKKTEIGIIPENWEVKKLGEVVTDKGLVRGPFGSSLKKEFFVKKGYKVYTQENAIYQNLGLGEYYINENKYRELKRFSIKTGDFIVSCSGTIGKIYRIPQQHKRGIINQALLIIRINKNTINDDFFYHYFSWDKFQIKIIDNTQGGAMQNLVGINQFQNTKLPLPPLSEQKAIARILSDFDELIESLDKLIEKKKLIKKATMQMLLTGKKRLPGFKDKWVKKKLGEIVNNFKGIGLSKGKLSISGRYECILYGELYTTYKEVIKDVKSNTNYYEGVLSKKGDILFPSSTTTTGIDLANASTILKNGVLLGGDIIILRPKEKVDSVFLTYYLNEVKKQQIAEKTTGITIYHLYAKDLVEIELLLPPSLAEQKAIAQILSDMDAEIEALEKKKKKYEMLKQGAMEQLLTGKVRVKERN